MRDNRVEHLSGQCDERTAQLKRELQDKLNWYTLYATEEEYDEKAVESILYLLDTLEPIAEDEIPDVQEAWQRFAILLEEREELQLGEEEEAEIVKRVEIFKESESAKETEGEKATKKTEANDIQKNRRDGAEGSKIVSFLTGYKGIVVAVLVILILAVIGGTQIEAIRNSGFFHWLKQDETGKQMVTTPENLTGNTEVNLTRIFNSKEEMPEWTKEWVSAVEELEVPEGFAVQEYEIKEFNHLKSIAAKYSDINQDRNIVFGILIYSGQVSFNTEVYGNYRVVEKRMLGDTMVEILEKEDEAGRSYYRILMEKDNCIYYLQGEDNLQELIGVATEYIEFVGKKSD